MPGQRQHNLEQVIRLLKELGKTPGLKKKKGFDGEPITLFEELTGFSFHWSGEEWIRTLEKILEKYQKESARVRAAQLRPRKHE